MSAVNGTPEDSGEGSTERRQPFEPKFKIKVSDDVTRNGESIIFTVITTKISSEEEESVTRQFEDFEWLHHNLTTQHRNNGIIVPPMFPRPVVDVKADKQTASVRGDEFDRDCRRIEKYLRLMSQHETFGGSDYLEAFLMKAQAALRTKVKKGFLSRMSSTVNQVRKGEHKDIDEYFLQQKQWAADYHTYMRDANTVFGKIVQTHRNLGSTFSHLSTTLAMSSAAQDGVNATTNKLFINFAEAIDDISQGLEVTATNSERTLGFTLDLYFRYMDPIKDTLFQRICLLIDYEDANRIFMRAKAEKKDAADKAKRAAHEAFQQCSDTARNQLKQQHQKRVLDYQAALVRYTEAQMKRSRDEYALLLKSLNAIKAISLQ